MEGYTRARERDRAKHLLDEQMLTSLPFRPSLNKTTEDIVESGDYVPVHERLGDVQRAQVRSFFPADSNDLQFTRYSCATLILERSNDSTALAS